MPYDAFISYCSEDKKIADAVCGTLEANKIRCWIAPRDVGAGRTWSSAIVEAIADSAVMVVIFSQHSNGSPQVMREIERAVNKGIAIGAELALTDITPEIVPGVELEKMGFAVRKTDRALLQESNQQLAATAPGRDGVLSKSIPGWNQ